MPVKKDGDRRQVEIEALLPGTPEDIWRIAATGDGTAAWFTRMEIEPRAGGKLSIDFGDGVSTTGEVVEWDPPRKFVYVEREWAPGAPDCFTEITIAARSGDRCVMRMVHTLFTSSEEWDDQLESFESGWPAFIEVLRVYLTRFKGLAASSFMERSPSKADALGTWTSLMDGLGLAGANVGERRMLSGPEPLEATVEHVRQGPVQRYVTVRLDGAAAGLLVLGTYTQGDENTAGVSRFVYGPSHASVAAGAKQAWRAWLTRRFPTGD